MPQSDSQLDRVQTLTGMSDRDGLVAGNLHPRERAVAALRLFVQAPLIDDDIFYGFIGDHTLMGTGLSFVDLHLLASVRTSSDQLWSRNKRLNEAATRLNCHYTES